MSQSQSIHQLLSPAHPCVGADVDPSCLQVVKELSRYTKQFRVLALSATPGSDTKVRELELNGLCLAAHVGY